MTFTEEYLGDDEDLKVESAYPSAFGITFTPKVSGIALGVVGVLGSLYLALNWLLPLYSKYQQLKADEASKQEQINQKKSGDLDRKIENLQVQLQQKEAEKEQVLAMFAKERDLDTIVLDVSNLLKNRNVELLSFIPQGSPVVIDDSSLGAAVNKKLKRQTYSAKLQGGFESTQAVIRDLERLQPLVIVKGLKSQAQEEKEVGIIRTAPTSVQVIPKAEPPISTDLQLDVIIPLSPEELAKLAPPPPPPEQGQQPPAEEKK
jgi:hypothetical protein